MSLIDQIKYNVPNDDAIAWKFPSEEIRLGSQLIVNESQEAVFFKGGKALDTFGPGTYTLSSGNLPILRRIINLPFGGKTPFAAEVWFVNKTIKRDLKWGTKGSIQIIDPLYNYPISVRAFGKWGMRIGDSRNFIVNIVGTKSLTGFKSYISIEIIEEYFIGEIIQRLTNKLAKFLIDNSVSIFQVSTHINDLSSYILNDLTPVFRRFGVEIINFNIERISIPEDEKKKFQEIFGKRMEIEQISKVNIGKAYTTMRTLDILEKAAENEGGNMGQLLGAGLGVGAGLGAGTTIGQQIGNTMNVQNEKASDEKDVVIKLQKLKQMLNAGLITKEDYDKKKKHLLDSM